MTTRKLVRTAVLLAVCLAFQLLKGISVYITGPMVNAVLILTALSCGLDSGIIIALIAPLAAWLIGATPVINMVPWMLPVIMAGNGLIVFFAWKFRAEGKLPLGLLLGSVAKAVWLWIMVWYVVLPFAGSALPEKMIATVRTTFSITQLITALLGSLIACLVWKRLAVWLKLRDTGDGE